MNEGKVYFVGAGPGDPGLITCKGREVLKDADVVVYDYLPNEDLLSLAPHQAMKLFVGKRSDSEKMSQDEINELLCQHARRGETVVRLKGGDPFLFGSGEEEALWLRRENVPFEVIPGVTSAFAAPAYAGIPLTHRGMSSSVHVIVSPPEDKELSDNVPWESLATSRGTLVFLCDLTNLKTIVSELLRYGMDKTTPAALIRWGTRPEQETLISTLGKMIGDAAEANFQPPAVITIGQVVTLRGDLNWFESLPLFGEKIIISEDGEGSAHITHLLTGCGAEVFMCPAVRTLTVPTQELQKQMAKVLSLDAMPLSYDWVLLTTPHAVDSLFEALNAVEKDARILTQAKLCAVDQNVATHLREHGLVPDLVSQDRTQEGVIEALALTEGQKVLLPRAIGARDLLPTLLERAGGRVTLLTLYDIVPDAAGIKKAKRLLTQGTASCIVFLSPTSVITMLDATGEKERQRIFTDVAIASINPATTRIVKQYGLPVDIEAPQDSHQELLEEMVRFVKES